MCRLLPFVIFYIVVYSIFLHEITYFYIKGDNSSLLIYSIRLVSYFLCLDILDYGAAPILLTISKLRKFVLFWRSPLIFNALRIISSFFAWVFAPVTKSVWKNIQK